MGVLAQNIAEVPYTTLSKVKGLKRKPQTGNPKSIVGLYWENKDPGGCIPATFLLPYLGSHFSPFTRY